GLVDMARANTGVGVGIGNIRGALAIRSGVAQSMRISVVGVTGEAFGQPSLQRDLQAVIVGNTTADAGRKNGAAGYGCDGSGRHSGRAGIAIRAVIRCLIEIGISGEMTSEIPNV